jgi:PP-loop superfamily ATP-utilizing enzyme
MDTIVAGHNINKTLAEIKFPLINSKIKKKKICEMCRSVNLSCRRDTDVHVEE